MTSISALTFCGLVLLALLLASASGMATESNGTRVAPVLFDPAPADRDGNRIADSLDQELTIRDPAEPARVIFSFDRPVTRNQLREFEQWGGEIRHIFRHAAYGFSGSVPCVSVGPLADALGENLMLVRLARSGTPSLGFSVSQIRARDDDGGDQDDAFAWDYGYTGDENASVAVAGCA